MGEKPNAETEQLASAVSSATAARGGSGSGIALPTPSIDVSIPVPVGGGAASSPLRDCLNCARPRPFNRDTDRFTGDCAQCGQSEQGANTERADYISGRHPKLTQDEATATGSYE